MLVNGQLFKLHINENEKQIDFLKFDFKNLQLLKNIVTYGYEYDKDHFINFIRKE